MRRTSTIDASWPAGVTGPVEFRAVARDLLTPYDGRARVLAHDTLDVRTSADRTVEQLTASPPRPNLQELVGTRAGGGFRARLNEIAPRERDRGTPLFLLLDDLAPATLVAPFAWSRWLETFPPETTTQRSMVGICAGFRPGASSLNDDGTSRMNQDVAPMTSPLVADGDPSGWHELADVSGVGHRRARRIDVGVEHEAENISIDSHFQDTLTDPAVGRVIVHEYLITASADLRTGVLEALHADPRVLPYAECPFAATNVDRLLGVPMQALRAVVLDRLKGTAGCTHLNDALRALAEVPALVAALRAS